ncbi:MAG: hypothetical protein OXH39_07920 [Candidatus Poribacteria bacterium]|nr:hypothetical protein [Candidatus Poribacteria bacterium]
MNFFKKIWFLALVGLIILSIGTYLFFRGRTPTEPIKFYKTTQPTPKQRPLQTETTTKEAPITPDHSHDHPHDHGSNDHAAVPTATQEKYDWRDDSTFETPPPKNDPWKQTKQETEVADAADTYPPKDWYKTEDPVLRAEYYGAQMLKQFGDTPEVRIVSDWELKKEMDITPTHEELITYLEALYHLFPRDKTLQALNYHRELRAKGVEVKMVPEGDPR